MSAAIAIHLAHASAPGVLALPVADRAAMGVALGLALGGRPVVATLDGAGRLPAVVEVLLAAGEFALAGGYSVPLVVRVPYGPEAHGLDGGAGRVVGHLPGVAVVSGSSAARSEGLVASALAANRPVVVLEARANDRSPPEPIALDAATVEREGDAVLLVSWAGGVAIACEAADHLAREGVSACVLDLVSLAPIDRSALGAALARCGRLVVVDPAGDPLADAVVAAALDVAFWYLEAPPRRVEATLDAVLTASRAIREE